ncbi:MAG TPA: NAD-binding protein, partial [Stenomitos sp.]
FKLEGRLFRIVCQTIPTHHPWCDRRQLSELNASYRRIFSFARGTDPLPRGLHGWDTHTKVQADDRIAYVETTDTFAPEEDAGTSPPRKLNLSLSGIRALQSALNLRWKALSQTERAAVWCLFAILTLFSLGTLLYRLQYPQIGLSDAANATLVLLLGGFDNLFGQLKVPFFIPGWLHLFSLGLTLSGTVFIGVLYALLTEKVLAAKVSFLRSRPPIPQANHVAVIGLGQTGRQVATLLQELKYACVGVTDKDLPAETLPHLPLATGEFRMALTKANLATARSALVLTQDETTNLEIGLTIQSLNPNCRLVLRTADSQFGSHIVNLLTHAKAFSVEALAAEAFAAAAFGENVLGLFHLEQETVLAVEYRVEASDTLQGRLIGEVAYGYDVVPLLHGRSQDPATFMPSEDIRLRSNDRLIVLATGEGVQAIEHGRIVPPNWSVRVEKAFSDNAVFEGAAAIARLSGCELGVARHAMSQLPQVLPFFLYRLQAQRLVRELAKVQVVAQAMPAAVQL